MDIAVCLTEVIPEKICAQMRTINLAPGLFACLFGSLGAENSFNFVFRHSAGLHEIDPVIYKSDRK